MPTSNSKAIVKVEKTAIISPAKNALIIANDILTDVMLNKVKLENSYARLSNLLFEIQKKEYWREEYRSWGEYIQKLADRFDMGVRQLHYYIATAKALSGIVTEDQLNKMGISKAKALTDGFRMTGSIPKEVIELAEKPDSTVDQVKQLLFETVNPEALEKGKWYSQEGFYATEEMIATFNQAAETAKRCDPAISEKEPAWKVRREILYRLSMEFISSHPEVETYGEGTVEF